MTDQSTEGPATYKWYTRPVLFVADIQRALRFYVDVLGFEKAWHEADAASMGVMQRLGGFARDAYGVRNWKLLVTFQSSAQGLAFDERHDIPPAPRSRST